MESSRNSFISHHHGRSCINDNNSITTVNNDPSAIWNSGTNATTIPQRILDWNHYHSPCDSFYDPTTTAAAAAAAAATSSPQGGGGGGEGVDHALMVKNHAHLSPFGGGVGCCGSQQYHDPHLTCLKLGKRQYFGEVAADLGDRRQELAVAAAVNNSKRGKPCNYEVVGEGVLTVAAAAVARCQVEGCQVALVNAKEYHRRHKVCEMHSKAPKVLVLGLEQRFCQQCSRFQFIGVLDDK